MRSMTSAKQGGASWFGGRLGRYSELHAAHAVATRPCTVGQRCPERLHRDHPGIDNRTSRQIRLRPRLIAEGTNVHVRSAALYAGCHGLRAQSTNVTFVSVADATTGFKAWRHV